MYDVNSDTKVLGQLRRLYNNRTQTGSPVKNEIPAASRAWVLCDGHWVEVLNDRALEEALGENDPSTIVSIVFRHPDAPSPNTVSQHIGVKVGLRFRKN